MTLIKNNNPNRSNPFSGLLPKLTGVLPTADCQKILGLDKVFTNVLDTPRISQHPGHEQLQFGPFVPGSFPCRLSEIPPPVSAGLFPYFLIPREQFDPLLEVDMTFTNQLSTGLNSERVVR